MQYAMLVYYQEQAFNALPEAEQLRLRDACNDWHAPLVQQGLSSGGLRLQPITTATTLREREGQLVIADGPFAETKEVLGGFVHLECRDLDEAIAHARRFPSLPAGFTLELRPVLPEGAKCGYKA